MSHGSNFGLKSQHSNVLGTVLKSHEHSAASASSAHGSTVEVGGNPIGVAVSPDGAFVYVVNFDDSSVSVISIFDNNNVVDTVLRVGFHPLFVAITPFDPRQGNDSGGGRRLMLLGIIQSLQWFSYTVSPDSNIYSDCQALEKNQTKA